jgi:hypothetical protein
MIFTLNFQRFYPESVGEKGIKGHGLQRAGRGTVRGKPFPANVSTDETATCSASGSFEFFLADLGV